MVTRIRQHNTIVARNFIHEESQRRMKEVVSAAQQQATNSIFVHATPIIYFSQVKSGIKCSCREKVVVNNQLPVGTPGTASGVVELDLTTPLFGNFQSATDIADELQDDDLIGDETPNQGRLTVSSLFGNATECPVCFRVGTLPGYQPLGYSRQVYTTVNCLDAEGFFIDSSQSISTYVCDDKMGGFVDFKMTVPMIFHEVLFATYNGREIVPAKLSINGFPVSANLLNNYKGKEVVLRVQGVTFTHCVFQFKLTTGQLKADFPQDQRPKDYSVFDSTQPVQIVTDKSIPNVNNGDIIYKVGYNSFWKVNDFEYFRMNDKTVIGWSLSARLLQADEIQQKLLSFG